MSDARPYQNESMEMIREEFRNGWTKILLWLATGAGKTFIFCRMVKDAVARGKRCLIVVRGRKLVDQASKRLAREEVLHGVLMAGHWNYRPHAPVQVCSIDTLIARRIRPEADLIIIDEAHQATSAGYKEVLADYPDAFIVAVTATPWVDGGLRHVADRVVHPITAEQLVDEGYLVPFRCFGPAAPDMSAVQTSSATKDFNAEQAEEAMCAGQLTGKIIEHWQKIADSKPTICFAVNVHHSKILVERFLQAGIAAEHVDANSPDHHRELVYKRLESGQTKVVCNVGIAATGVDIPQLGAIILARPTKSRNLFIQMCGRGTRTFPGKEDCILLDHAGNIDRLGHPTDEEDVDLDGRTKLSAPKETKTCKECFAMYRGPLCPECGAVPVAPERSAGNLEESNGELVELKKDPVKKALRELIKEAKAKGRKTAWAYHKLVDRFGIEACAPFVPKYIVSSRGAAYVPAFAGSPYRGIKLN